MVWLRSARDFGGYFHAKKSYYADENGHLRWPSSQTNRAGFLGLVSLSWVRAIWSTKSNSINVNSDCQRSNNQVGLFLPSGPWPIDLTGGADEAVFPHPPKSTQNWQTRSNPRIK